MIVKFRYIWTAIHVYRQEIGVPTIYNSVMQEKVELKCNALYLFKYLKYWNHSKENKAAVGGRKVSD